MMQSVRSVATKVAAILFAVLMLVFVITSIDWSTIGQSQAVGSIDGKKVDARTYDALVNQNIEVRQRSQPGRLSLEDTEQIRNEVWEQLVQQQVLERQYDRLDIEVSQDDIVQALRNEPPREVMQAAEFQTDGRFDLAKYQRWLVSPGASQILDGLAAQYREELRRSRLLQQVTADVFLSDAALWQRYKDQKEQVTVNLTAIVPRRVVPDSAVTVTPAEISEYYRQHPDEFKRPRTAYLRYITLSRATDASDTTAALERAKAIRAEIAGGAPFAEVARRESSDTASAANGGDLGEFGKGTMDPAFEQAAFSLPVNAVSEPVLSAFGYHVIQVTKRAGDKVTARHILVPVELAGAHRDLLDARADSLDRLAADRTDPGALEEVAKALGAQVRAAEPTQEGGRVLAGNVLVPDAAVWAFGAEQGTLSEVIETAYALYLFRLDSVSAAGVPKLETVRGAVEQAVRDEKKLVQARELATAYLKRLDNSEPFIETAKSMGLASQEFGPFPRVNPPLTSPAVVGAAFSVKPGERTGVIETKEGLYVLQGVARTPADTAEFQKTLDQIRARGIMQAKQERARNYLAALRERATVEDNRAELYRTARLQAQQQQQQLPPGI
jgi:peptidyl-prolyl cis-trans isomerase D